jgi:nitroreductase
MTNMSVTDAIMSRNSVRAFLPNAVEMWQVRDILAKATRAATGCNFQPWRIHVVSGAARDALVETVMGKAMTGARELPEYPIQPDPMWPEIAARYGKMGADMFGLMDIARDDKDARAAAVARNFEFFGAPVGIFFSIDKRFGPAQWADCGMLMQNIMLLAVEAGMATCPQESWAMFAPTVKAFLGLDDGHILWSGMAMGHPDPAAKVNTIRTDRAAVDEFTTFLS